MPETPFEITLLRERLRADFTGRLPEATTGTAEERERNFLSRALAAFAIHKLAGCTLDEAAAAVVDGSGDGGIDAIYYAPTSHRLWAVQSKFIADGQGEPNLGEVMKFKKGLEDLLRGRLDAFATNTAWAERIAQIKLHFEDHALQVRAVLVYSGVHAISSDRPGLFDDLKQRFSAGSEYFDFQTFNLSSLHDWLTETDGSSGVREVKLTLLKPGWVLEPYETVYGLVRLVDFVELQKMYGKRLITANIRGYKGETEVNTRIVTTVCEEPQNFFYLNNGLTAYCERLHVEHFDRDNADQKRITAYGFSIINGAQTLGSLEAARTSSPSLPLEGFVFLKVVSLERCVENVVFAQRITESTNFQNQIVSRDFVALDELQEQLARTLKLSDVHYHYKDADDIPDPDDTNFSFEEAITALACLEQEKECDLYARALGNRKSLWSSEEVYPDDRPYRSRYKRLFHGGLSARTIWRAVQTQRVVIELLKADTRSSTGLRKDFFQHGRWLVLNLVFLHLRPELGDVLTLTDAEKTAIVNKTGEIAEMLWTVANTQRSGAQSFKAMFCNTEDCRRLRSGTLGNLSQAAL